MIFWILALSVIRLILHSHFSFFHLSFILSLTYISKNLHRYFNTSLSLRLEHLHLISLLNITFIFLSTFITAFLLILAYIFLYHSFDFHPLNISFRSYSIIVFTPSDCLRHFFLIISEFQILYFNHLIPFF